MDQKIFALNLPMPATSLYLLVDALTVHAGGTPPTREQVAERWRDGDEALEQAYQTLEGCGVISLHGEHVRVEPVSDWRAVQ